MPRKMSTSGGNPLLLCELEMLSRSRYWRRKRWIAQHQESKPSANEELRALTAAHVESDRFDPEYDRAVPTCFPGNRRFSAAARRIDCYTLRIIGVMSTSTRRKFGRWLAVLAVAVVLALAFTDVPLVTRSSTYFADTGATTSSVHLHWPLVVAAVIFLAGVTLVLFPRRSNVA